MVKPANANSAASAEQTAKAAAYAPKLHIASCKMRRIQAVEAIAETKATIARTEAAFKAAATRRATKREDIKEPPIVVTDMKATKEVADVRKRVAAAKAQCQIELLFFPLHYFHSFRDGLGVKKSNFFFYK